MKPQAGFDESDQEPPRKLLRVSKACARCRNQKLKCDGKFPCARCQRLKVPCYEPRDNASPPSAFASGSAAVDTLDSLQGTMESALERIARLERIMGSIGDSSGSDPGPVIQLQQHHHHRRQLPASHAMPSPRSAAGLTPAQFPAPFNEIAATRQNSPAGSETDEGQGQRGNDRPAAGGHGALEHRRSSAISRASLHDPIKNGIITEIHARYLIDYFVLRCHPYLPILDVEEMPTMEEMRQTDLFLLCSILAIAARYGDAQQEAFDANGSTNNVVERLFQTAETLLGQTLAQSKFRLGDVQAVIFLHAFSLRLVGKGSDAWILSGHAFRLAKRLQIDRTILVPRNTERFSPSSARRTWLALCSSDAFPSLGFGRPASPRENLEGCLSVLEMLGAAFTRGDQNLGQETFIASQVELAHVSRQLMDWVAQVSCSAHQSADLPSVAHRYRRLDSMLSACEARWDKPRLGTTNQRRASILYRLHVKLCLATFVLRMCAAAGHGTATAANSDVAAVAGEGKGSEGGGWGGGGGHRVLSTHTQEDLQAECREACIAAATAMVEIHAGDRPLVCVPDYLITALAQAIVASVSVLETQRDLSPTNTQQIADKARWLVDDSLRILSYFGGIETNLPKFLAGRIRERAKRSSLFRNTPYQLSTPLVDIPDHPRTLTSWQALSRADESSRTISDPHRQNNVRSAAESSRATFYDPIQTSPLQPMSHAAHYGAPYGTASGAGGEMQQQQHQNQHHKTNSTADSLSTPGSGADWGDFARWWDADDPLQLLFGMDASSSAFWDGSLQHLPPG
ncbi:hypothetical protein K437DRAFT_260099 [Tilletiaria anomala UBC 951]|uniref:Zn(2)-C6 fungal-type domain-containing protein n=1 Tax=Tilletiaria anomala (strain ATCC 24038 / CBS 436.72 / UBC 951) TaxID=1037660 RepID=A0A066V503_TILAU|nr:uncharacterized protein K437DRAFT_260099 [Tilletiaria anomala UBC 951]KDN36551.1 hypothetical protein K437DRAFT_260099 [Tilletiaria anomala UBC 951]